MAAISVHSYGNVLIFPWGYKEEAHPEKARISKFAYKVVNTIRWVTGEIFVPGTAYEVLTMLLCSHQSFRCCVFKVFGRWGFAGGATDDWYISLGIPYSFTFELPERDADGWHGFLLPPENIKRVTQDFDCSSIVFGFLFTGWKGSLCRFQEDVFLAAQGSKEDKMMKS